MQLLTDKFGRKITYLRLAVTDRCNLRCQYCMPAEGIDLVEKSELLSFKEMYRLTRLFSELGVEKIRLTGGEPFVRKNFIDLLKSLSFNKKLKEINITTNGALISKHINELEALKINTINLSLDTLQKDRFKIITRRDLFDKTLETLELLLNSKIKTKLNVVIQSGFNTDEIIDFIELTKNINVEVRFIEEMPFNGTGLRATNELWDFNRIKKEFDNHYKEIETIPVKKSSTSYNYKIKGYKGQFGVIPAFTRSICNDCNRVRVTATGLLKNCLFDGGVMDLKQYLRSDYTDDQIKQILIDLISRKPKNGFVAEAERKTKGVSESMSTIGG